MHYGTVNNDLDAVVSLIILGDDGASERFDFIIDTGLSEAMVIPQYLAVRLNLPPDDSAVLRMGDGTARVVARYSARIVWHDRPQGVHVAGMGGEFLIGMGLLSGSNVNIDAVPGGSVTITELPAAS